MNSTPYRSWHLTTNEIQERDKKLLACRGMNGTEKIRKISFGALFELEAGLGSSCSQYSEAPIDLMNYEIHVACDVILVESQ